MGATTFTNIGGGETPQDAFAALVEQAKYDYGHAGYSGTIAEKDSFVMIESGPMPRDAAIGLAGRLLDEDDERIADKWGPAGCIAVDDGSFLFFGWASE